MRLVLYVPNTIYGYMYKNKIKTIVKKQETTFLVTRTEAGQLGT
jgi:hypothetical protein